MGGYGSGKWYRGGAKDTVEDSWSLDINWMIREGLFDGMRWSSGAIRWSDSRTGEETSSIGYELWAAGRSLRLHYRLPERDESFDFSVQLTTTDLPWGGVRWWFICPLTCNDRYCGRRVGKIYLPRGGRYYGCRHCYDLTYTSCQESHKYGRMWRSLAAECNTDAANARLLREGDFCDERRMERLARRREQLRRRRQARGRW